jgi:hypothetical protein
MKSLTRLNRKSQLTVFFHPINHFFSNTVNETEEDESDEDESDEDDENVVQLAAELAAIVSVENDYPQEHNDDVELYHTVKIRGRGNVYVFKDDFNHSWFYYTKNGNIAYTKEAHFTTFACLPDEGIVNIGLPNDAYKQHALCAVIGCYCYDV